MYLTTWKLLWGPYETKQWAEDCLQEQIDELYFLEYYPNPYVDFIEESLSDEMYFNVEDMEYSQYKEMWEHDNCRLRLDELESMPKREKRRRKQNAPM